MESRLKFKTKISITFIFVVLIVFFCLTQFNNLLNGDFLNKISWIIYGITLVYIFIFNLFFTRSFELDITDFKVRYVFFLRSPKTYNIDDIDSVKAIRQKGKGVATLTIKIKGKEITFYHFLISEKSIKELISRFKDINIDASIK